MGSSRSTPEFKAEAVRQVLERGYSVKEVAERIGVSSHALYIWVRKARPGAPTAANWPRSSSRTRSLRRS